MPHAYAATAAKAALEPFEFAFSSELGANQVEIAVETCGVCHSDLSMLNNDWGITAFPFVPGHEIVGRIAAVGSNVATVKEGEKVGLGWFASSCMHCRPCLSGDHNLCETGEQTIVGRYGGFAERVRCHEVWATPLPDALDAAKAGPLFCGGITVFNPIVEMDVRPTDRVGVVGIGGLGHLALQFLNKWGCEVTAFTSTGPKAVEARGFGAHHVVNSRDPDAIAALSGSLDFILVTANATLPWDAYVSALKPKGRLHVVGVTPEPIPMPAFPLIAGQKSLSGTPLGSPKTTLDMLDFCARHDIGPQTEQMPMREADQAFERLHANAARYRIVLEADF